VDARAVSAAAPKRHHYRASLSWTASAGATTSYTAYSRDHLACAPGKPDVPLSSDPSFRGNAARYNPEELLVVSLSSCHMLWYLHLCAAAGVVVTAYADEPEGTMVEDADGGRFERVTLRPRVTISAGDAGKAAALHHEAHRRCYVANSVNFPVGCEPVIAVAELAR
jgi:organic hydroperoxide reductase OsmC/OhrA